MPPLKKMNSCHEDEEHVPTEEEALKCLANMKTFCKHLQNFIINHVPVDANLQDYTSTRCIEEAADCEKWLLLLRATRELQRTPYMPGIPKLSSEHVKKQLAEVVQLGSKT
jgi:hypothetical protein